MARQEGNIALVGTIDNLSFYKAQGQYYVRRKGSAKPDAASCSRARLLALSSRAASLVYQRVKAAQRSRRLFDQLQKRAMQLPGEEKTLRGLVLALSEVMAKEGLLSKEDVAALGAADSFSATARPRRKNKKIYGPLHRVRIRSAEGRWVRIGHSDEWELLQQYAEMMQVGDAWVAEFLKSRKGQACYAFSRRRGKRRVLNKGVAKEAQRAAAKKRSNQAIVTAIASSKGHIRPRRWEKGQWVLYKALPYEKDQTSPTRTLTNTRGSPHIMQRAKKKINKEWL